MNVKTCKSDLADKSEQAGTKNNTTGCLQEMRLKEQIFRSVESFMGWRTNTNFTILVYNMVVSTGQTPR